MVARRRVPAARSRDAHISEIAEARDRLARHPRWFGRWCQSRRTRRVGRPGPTGARSRRQQDRRDIREDHGGARGRRTQTAVQNRPDHGGGGRNRAGSRGHRGWATIQPEGYRGARAPEGAHGTQSGGAEGVRHRHWAADVPRDPTVRAADPVTVRRPLTAERHRDDDLRGDC